MHPYHPLEGGRELRLSTRVVLSNGFDRLEHGGLKILVLGQVLIDRISRVPWYRQDGDAFPLAERLNDLTVVTIWGEMWMLVLWGESGIGRRRFQRIWPNASAVPPSASISLKTCSTSNSSTCIIPAQAWRMLRLAAISLESLSPPFVANAWAVVMWMSSELSKGVTAINEIKN